MGLRFGDFELDVRAGELRKHRLKIRLQDQSLQILLMLLEHPGEVVLREEIRAKLWPNNTIVEFDHSINAAIKRLRNALGESAEEPRFIETLAKRGYRFAGEVARENSGDPEPAETVSHYRIRDKIGEGGMGEVYRATDTKLGRDVALKFLPVEVADDPERLSQFEREAKVLASLNHSNIAAIYGIEERALVMELVEGKVLKGPVSLETALDYARQIADALAAAHEKGIVHRDLKPANIMVTATGVVKVLDFGLAKAAGEQADSALAGTPSYMSPEQAQGKTVDRRTDVWAFGCVLYEMLTGKPLFEGATTEEILGQIARKEPDLAKVPEKVRRLLGLCLKKDPKERLQAIGDWRLLIEDAPAAARKTRFFAIAWPAAAVAIALALGALLFSRSRETSPPRPHVRFQMNSPEGQLNAYRLSPDGRFLGYTVAVGSNLLRVFIRSLDGFENRPLIDVTGVTNFTWFWSRDGEYVAYQVGDKLYKIARSGGQALLIGNVADEPGWGAWLDNDVIVLGTPNAAYRVSASGGAVVKISDQFTHRPAWLPGRRFLYASPNAVFARSIDGGKPVQILPDPVFTFYVEPSRPGGPGYLVFLRAGTVYAQPFDADKLELRGDPIPIVAQAAGVSANYVSASNNGVLVYGGDVSPEVILTWIDRSGRKLETVGKPFVPWRNPEIRLSPDESRAIVPITGADGPEVWMADFKRNTFSRFAFRPSSSAIWSPDGRKVLWATWDGNRYLKSADGSGQDELYFKNPDECVVGVNSCGSGHLDDWSPDGKLIVVNAGDAKIGTIWLVPTEGDRKPFLYRERGLREYFGQISRDGRWMAYEAEQSSASQPGQVSIRIFIESIPAGRGRWQVSTEQSTWAIWRRDGKELFFVQGRKIMAAPIQLHETSVEIGEARKLFELPFLPRFQVSRDGQRFLIALPTESTTASRTVTVDSDWRAGLSR